MIGRGTAVVVRQSLSGITPTFIEALTIIPESIMSEPTLDVLARRLDGLEKANHRLERECRWWKRAGLGSLAGLAVLMIGGAASRSLTTIEAREFVLRDQNGAMRAALSIRPDGTPGLGLFDSKGQVRLSLDLGADESAGVNAYDATGTLRAALAVRPDGTPGIGLFDGLGKPRLSLDTKFDGKPGLNLFDPNDRVRAALAIRPDGTPGLGLFDGDGQIRQSVDYGMEMEARFPEMVR